MRHNLEQGSPEWHEFRKGKIGASVVPVIMGVSPFMTKYQLWQEMRGERPPQKENPAMTRGKELEPRARQHFENYMGVKVDPAVFSHDEFPYLICSLDGYNPAEKIILEIKCPTRISADESVRGKVPDHYIPQIMMQMYILDYDKAYYFCYDGHLGSSILVERDDEYIDNMVRQCHIFYNMVQSGIPPDLTEKDYVDMSKDVAYQSAESAYIMTCKQIEILEREKETLRKELHQRADGNNVVGRFTKFTQVVTKGRVVYENIPELKNVCLDIYRKPDVYSFRITINSEAK